MRTHVVTYANKSRGMFETLVNNQFEVPVTVLGMGEKWEGFPTKVKAYCDYTHSLPPRDIVVIVDGFDTQINGTLEKAVRRFRDIDKKIVVSVHPGLIPGAFVRKIFGTCEANETANSGLMMGYVENMRTLLDDMRNKKCKDDQRVLNTLCEKHEVFVDNEQLIFENTTPRDRTIKTDAIFIGFPGETSFHRWIRALHEYSQFFIKEIFLLFLLLFMVFRKVKYLTMGSLLLLLSYVDLSCV